jgi:hypothetical protein
MIRCLLLLCLALPHAALAAEPARVMILGTYHFANPGRDVHNVTAADVFTDQRQSELEAVTAGLARFGPTLVAVEWPAQQADERYAEYVDDSLAPSRNEVVQLGFRLARTQGLERVHGIDVKGDFPFGPVQAWAAENGRQAELAALQGQAQALVEEMTVLQADHSIGQVLHAINAPDAIRDSHALYAALLRFGEHEAQPGVALNAAWDQRNLGICARLLQALQPGDRAVVLFGHGHAYLLRRCISETPGVELVEATEFLPAPH